MSRLHVLFGVAVLLAAIAAAQIVWRPFETPGRGSATSPDASTDASTGVPAKDAGPAPRPLPPGLVRAIEDLRAAGFATTVAVWNGARWLPSGNALHEHSTATGLKSALAELRREFGEAPAPQASRRCADVLPCPPQP